MVRHPCPLEGRECRLSECNAGQTCIQFRRMPPVIKRGGNYCGGQQNFLTPAMAIDRLGKIDITHGGVIVHQEIVDLDGTTWRPVYNRSLELTGYRQDDQHVSAIMPEVRAFPGRVVCILLGLGGLCAVISIGIRMWLGP